jgi:multiple sugar transport system permease protein
LAAVSNAKPPTFQRLESLLGALVKTKRRRDTLEGYLFILPVVLGILFFNVVPMIISFAWSFTDYPMLRSPQWVGVQNYITMFTKDTHFWGSVGVTVTYAVTAVPLGIIAGFILAILLNQRVKGIAFFRTCFYIPTVVPFISSAILWGWLLNPDYGLVNSVLFKLHLPTSRFLAAPDSALGSLILMSLWGIGGGMVIYLAGLQGVSESLYEAAKIDGANEIQLFRYITIPMMTPTIFYNLVMGLIGAFQYFLPAFVLTSGGPLYATYFYGLMLYITAFHFTAMGMASAMAWVLLVVILALTLLVFRSANSWVFYETEAPK